MEEKTKYIDALVRRALGYDYDETTTIIENTKSGTKQRITKVRKHVPPDPATARWLLERLGPTDEDFKAAVGEFAERLKGKTENGDNENSD